MTTDVAWLPLRQELARWRHAGRTAEFWLRDDDAIEPTPALGRLLRLTGEFAVPVTLAIIPAYTGEALASSLEAAHTSVAVHGWSHRNHAVDGEKKQELGPHRPGDVVFEELSRGLTQVRRLHGQRALPMLVPPWNRIESGLLAGLGSIGFKALSAFGPPRNAPILVINSNVDIIDWHGTRGCRDHTMLVREVTAQLGRAFDGGDPVGLLTHHLLHDEAAWSFLQRLFETTARQGGKWRSAKELLEGSD
ncbi:polysaccharide deacetylase family protein [Pseudaminobacter sp. NGMCC 1.201702]|uniref:polysaccharide deacetylase family protein n=1 Tax=Pseudaminobacter sp. NGMCC 1.201702 TaxID=3391825 RepID=UPI0039EEB261